MIEHADTRELFKLLDDFCSAGQLRNLVKVYRTNASDFPINVKREEAFRSVVKLFNARAIPRQRLEELLERAEENGHQHIFFYTPTTKAVHAKLSDFQAVEDALLGGRTRAEAGLPKFQIHPRKVEVADVREEVRSGTQYRTWVYKLYAGAEKWVQSGDPVVQGDEKTVRYKLQYRREVIVVKWHTFGLLELRLPISSKKQLGSAREGLLKSLVNALDLENTGGNITARGRKQDLQELAQEFLAKRKRPITPDEDDHPPGMQALVPLHLPTATAKLDQEARADEVKWISVNETELDVGGCKVTVGTDHGQENIYGSDAVVGLLKTAKKTERLRVILHLREQKDFEEKISVEFCGYFKNEIRIGAQTTPEAVEFVVRRIWERAKEGKLPPSPVDAFAGEAPVNSPLLDVDFDTFSRHHPYLANALLRLQRWIKKNPAVEYLDPERLRKALGGGVAKYDAAAAVGKLVDAGVLVRKYKVRPKGKRRFQDAVFDSLDDVLEAELVDEDDQPINLREAEVVPVYGAAEKPQATSGRNGDGERDAVGANGKGRG